MIDRGFRHDRSSGCKDDIIMVEDMGDCLELVCVRCTSRGRFMFSSLTVSTIAGRGGREFATNFSVSDPSKGAVVVSFHPRRSRKSLLQLPQNLESYLNCIIRLFSAILVLIFGAPFFLLPISLFLWFFVRVQEWFRPLARLLQRNMAADRSPVFATFDQLLQGLPVIHAAGKAETFKSQFCADLDKSHQSWWVMNRWAVDVDVFVSRLMCGGRSRGPRLRILDMIGGDPNMIQFLPSAIQSAVRSAFALNPTPPMGRFHPHLVRLQFAFVSHVQSNLRGHETLVRLQFVARYCGDAHVPRRRQRYNSFPALTVGSASGSKCCRWC